jgi:hypothetical protein
MLGLIGRDRASTAVADFTKTSGRAAGREGGFDLVYQFFCFRKIVPRRIYYQLVEPEFLHLGGELRQPGRHPGSTTQVHDVAEGLVESPGFLAKVF